VVKGFNSIQLVRKSLHSVAYRLPSALAGGFLLVVLLFVLLRSAGCASNTEIAVVARVVDGDTIVIVGGERVRYIGIDAPEQGEPYYEEAKEFNERMVAGKRVRLERDISDRDEFGRLLRYVYVDGIFVNAEMVRNGYAYTRSYIPNTKYQDSLQRVEEEGRRLRKGIWK